MTLPSKKIESTPIGGGSSNVADATIEMVNHLIVEAARMNASDIHIEPGPKEAIVRYRIDGVLQVRRRFPLDQIPQVVSRVKIMSRLDVTEHRMPLDGRVGFGRPSPNEPFIDLRISTVPLLPGEKVCIRLIYKDKEKSDIEHMGLTEENLAVYRSMVDSPSGLLIHVGPAGSGKTSSVYAAIQHLNDPGRNISTVEDPIEYELEGVNQAQVNPEQGLTFGVVLRAYMRQDCNVILVGEIRDGETCEIAIQAALTGHMILGTLHAESCVGAIARLQELGISNYFIGSALKGVVSQRLVRRLCEKCKRAVPPPQRLADALGLPLGQPIHSAVGCKHCSRGGFKGRFAIHEVMCPDEETRDRIYHGAAPSKIEEAALEAGMIPLWLDGFHKVARGETTIGEILRVVRGVTMGKGASGEDPLGGIVETLVPADGPRSRERERGAESL